MTERSDGGYILASALGTLLAISVVAAALAGNSGETLSRVKNAERASTRDAALESALVAIGAQLATDPRRRAIDLDKPGTLPIFDEQIRFRIQWDASKIDVNLADPAEIESRLRDAGMATKDYRDVVSFIQERRSNGQAIRLLSDLNLDAELETCLAAYLTVFGGQAHYETGAVNKDTLIGEPAAGSRLAIDLALIGAEAQGLSATILITGDAATPWAILDWRSPSPWAMEGCDAR